MSFLNETPIQYYAQTRDGRNQGWEISNHTPQKIGKERKLSVLMPAIKSQYKLIFSSRLVGGKSSGEYCYLYKPNPNIGQKTKKVEKEIIECKCSGDKEELVEVILSTKRDRHEISGKPVYEISIILEYCGNRIELVNWETTPLRNHKYESSPKGKRANSSNNTAKMIFFSSVESNNSNIDEFRPTIMNISMEDLPELFPLPYCLQLSEN